MTLVLDFCLMCREVMCNVIFFSLLLCKIQKQLKECIFRCKAACCCYMLLNNVVQSLSKVAIFAVTANHHNNLASYSLRYHVTSENNRPEIVAKRGFPILCFPSIQTNLLHVDDVDRKLIRMDIQLCYCQATDIEMNWNEIEAATEILLLIISTHVTMWW